MSGGGDAGLEEFVLHGEFGELLQIGFNCSGPVADDVEPPLLPLEDILLLVPALPQQVPAVVGHRVIYYFEGSVRLLALDRDCRECWGRIFWPSLPFDAFMSVEFALLLDIFVGTVRG